MTDAAPWPPATASWHLPAGVRSRRVATDTGLSMQVLEAGDPGQPLVMLLHGFPEISFSWRNQLPALAAAGWHVVAPDQRGYGLTTGWQGGYDDPLLPFRLPSLVDDAAALVRALGHQQAAALIGHDAGAIVTAWAGLLRPEVFRSVVMMSAPFGGPPARPTAPPPGMPTLHEALAALPRPRKHYQWYYSTPWADSDMRDAPQGLHAFLRAYFHMKSADWAGNDPKPLAGWTAESMATLPTYYVMDLDDDMPAAVAAAMPTAAEVAANRWLSDDELAVYVEAFERNTFQGALNWYRCLTSDEALTELSKYGGRSIDVPAMFIGGHKDWGIYQKPGVIERMASEACTRFEGVQLIDGAGHWVQQERADAVNTLLLDFLARRRESANESVDRSADGSATGTAPSGARR